MFLVHHLHLSMEMLGPMVMIMVRNVIMVSMLMDHVSQSQMMAVMQDFIKRVEFALKMMLILAMM